MRTPHRLAVLVAGSLLVIGQLAVAQSANQIKQNPPISLGTSGGNVHNRSGLFCCSGTLGSLVQDGGGTQYILSNNHVLADTGTGSVGDQISQPGLVDVGCVINSTDANIAANLSSWVPLGTANVDAALATVIAGEVDSTGNILEVGVPSRVTLAPSVGLSVGKSGRTTGLTCASIGSTSTNVKVQYQTGCGSGKKFTITYTNQIAINSSSFSAAGDSGSLVVSTNGVQPVGLLFAGSSSTTIANPISQVLSALDSVTKSTISFVGTSASSGSICSGGAAPATAQSGPSAARLARAAAAKERHAAELMADEAVLGVGVGASDSDSSQAVVVIYLEEGRTHAPLPAELNGVPTKVVRTDAIRAYGWNESTTNACRSK